MEAENDRRKFLWWQTGVTPDRQAEVGKSMGKTAIIWFAVIAVLAVIAGIAI